MTANELASGRMIEQVCKVARRTACLRDVRESKEGMVLEDISSAVVGAIDRLSTTISRENVKSYIPDIPAEARVVSVTAVARRNS